jgi:hypothetical protein
MFWLAPVCIKLVFIMKKWALRLGIAFGVLLVIAVIAGTMAARRFEPFVIEQAKKYLAERFDSELEFAAFKVSFPMQSPWQVIRRAGRGGKIRLRGEGLALRHRGRRDLPPLFSMREFVCDIDMHSVLNPPALIESVDLKELRIHVPPKGERPKAPETATKEAVPEESQEKKPPAVAVRRIRADGSQLTILPKDPKKDPLVFDLAKLTLLPKPEGGGMNYEAHLTNARPPGTVVAKGAFGPWNGEEPGESAIQGTYVLANADLGVFKGIGGKLNSTGRFDGRLNYIVADGETRMNDFSLDLAQHPMKLDTKFHAIIDGTNGNTVLDPVQAKLGQSMFTCKGEVAKREGDPGKRILIDVDMRDARLEDVLFLAMKQERPFMRGPLKLSTKLEIPPGTGTIGQRLLLRNGKFQIVDAHFTGSTIQSKIDEFSRRGQGQPGEESVSEVPVRMKGDFELGGGSIRFSSLNFEIPGALLNLAGQYRFLEDDIDFLGEVLLEAKVSQLFKGWKKIALKPVDPFFSKRGAGTYLPIRIHGSRAKPEFGLTKTAAVDSRLGRR